MAGHSKWSQIKRAKAVTDGKRAKVFAKLSKEISIAVRIGGGPDPEMNARLRMILLKCRGANMPADNIDRAIKKAAGAGEGGHYEELTYEIYGPNGVAILAEINTDNRNRAAAEIRFILSKNNGTLASVGAVSRLFQRKGQIVIARDAVDEDALMELALEAGAEDFKADDECYEILAEPGQFEEVHNAIEAKGIMTEIAHVTSLPEMTTAVEGKNAESVRKLLDALEDNEDTNGVFCNAEFEE
jgi:YebC/PmpR family DNA-binding regulatory protein